ncbi:hypothetical protein K6H09_002006 [Candida tropicalis]
MLQQRQISKILEQGLKPIEFPQKRRRTNENEDEVLSTGSINTISLLSNQGIPLITISQPATSSSSTTSSTTTTTTRSTSRSKEDYKIYSILSYNSLKNTKDNKDESESELEWNIIEFEKDLKCLIHKVLDLYLILYYNNDEIPDEYVKIISDNLCSVLKDGLKGYSDE